MLRVERRRYGPREVFRLSWGRTSLDSLDRYTVGTAMKSASFASQLYTPILNRFKATSAYLRVPPEDVKLDGLLRRVMGDAPIGLPPRAIHFWKALVTRNILYSDSVRRS